MCQKKSHKTNSTVQIIIWRHAFFFAIKPNRKLSQTVTKHQGKCSFLFRARLVCLQDTYTVKPDIKR